MVKNGENGAETRPKAENCLENQKVRRFAGLGGIQTDTVPRCSIGACVQPENMLCYWPMDERAPLKKVSLPQ